jgi:hypothetical protein
MWCIATYTENPLLLNNEARSFTTTDLAASPASWAQAQIDTSNTETIRITELKFVNGAFLALLSYATATDPYAGMDGFFLIDPATSWARSWALNTNDVLMLTAITVGNRIWYLGIHTVGGVRNYLLYYQAGYSGAITQAGNISTDFSPSYSDKADLVRFNDAFIICVNNCLLYSTNSMGLGSSFYQITLPSYVAKVTKMVVVNNNLLIFGNGYVICWLSIQDFEIYETISLRAPVTSAVYVHNSLFVYSQDLDGHGLEINDAPAFDFTSLITDRNIEDVKVAQELNASDWQALSAADKQKWLQGLKGCLNASDLNRVGFAVVFLTSFFLGYGVSVSTVAQAEWTMSDVPLSSDLSIYLANILSLNTAIKLDSVTLPTTMKYLDFAAANSIEESLLMLNEALKSMANSFIYSGTIACGQIPEARV